PRMHRQLLSRMAQALRKPVARLPARGRARLLERARRARRLPPASPQPRQLRGALPVDPARRTATGPPRRDRCAEARPGRGRCPTILLVGLPPTRLGVMNALTPDRAVVVADHLER